jgi:hypothetical protein
VGVENTAPVFSDVTNATFSVSDRAMMMTKKARDLVIPQFLVKKRFFDCHLGLPHLVERGSASQGLGVKDNIIIPQSPNYFARHPVTRGILRLAPGPVDPERGSFFLFDILTVWKRKFVL